MDRELLSRFSLAFCLHQPSCQVTQLKSQLIPPNTVCCRKYTNLVMWSWKMRWNKGARHQLEYSEVSVSVCIYLGFSMFLLSVIVLLSLRLKCWGTDGPKLWFLLSFKNRGFLWVLLAVWLWEMVDDLFSLGPAFRVCHVCLETWYSLRACLVLLPVKQHGASGVHTSEHKGTSSKIKVLTMKHFGVKDCTCVPLWIKPDKIQWTIV